MASACGDVPDSAESETIASVLDHSQPHLCAEGFCICGCDDCTLRVAGGCICDDCPCGWWETADERPDRDPKHEAHALVCSARDV